MVNQMKILIDSEQVSNLIVDLVEIDGIEVEIENYDLSPPDENKTHPSYNLLPPSDITTVLITLPAIITSLTGLAKVLLDYKLKAAQKEPKKKALKEPSIVIDDQVFPLSRFLTADDLSKLLEEKTRVGKGSKSQTEKKQKDSKSETD